MWYRKAAGGYIRFEQLANHLASMIFPALYQLKKSPQFKNLSNIFDNVTKTKDNADKIRIFLHYKKENDIFQEQINLQLEDLYSHMRFDMMREGFNVDFEIDIITGISGYDFTAAYSPGRLLINLYEIVNEESLSKNLEHELIHMHQLSYRQNKPYTEEERPKIVKKLEGNYFDIKEEGQAFVANIMRELPSLEESIQNARIYIMNNPNYSYRDYNSIAEEYIQNLLSNNQNFTNYLKQSQSFREIMYGTKDKSPMENEQRRKKLLTVLHYALEQEAQKLMLAA